MSMKLNNCDRTENFLHAEKIFFDALIKSYSKEITKQERLKNNIVACSLSTPTVLKLVLHSYSFSFPDTI